MSAEKVKKSKKNSDKKKLGLITKLRQFFLNDKLRRTVGLFLLLFSFYILVAFTSFLFTWKIDQDLLFGSWKELLFNPELEVANWLGKFGAMTSHLFINDWFGVSSFLFIGIFSLRHK